MAASCIIRECKVRIADADQGIGEKIRLEFITQQRSRLELLK
jgi:hypothetical protein